MGKKYEMQRKEEIRKKKAKVVFKTKTKIKITDEVICCECNKFSGWTNEDLRYISGNREIKCQQCHKPCIRALLKSGNINIVRHE